MFKTPAYLLWMLPAVLAAAGLFWLAAAKRRRLTAAFGDAATILRLLPTESITRRRIQGALRLSALVLIFAALAGPQWGVEITPTQNFARDVIIAVDVSQSMLAEDIKPDRLSRAKEELALLIDELKGNRVGVIAFAGEAAVVCPLTTDLGAAKQLLRALEPSSIPVPGTAIGKALRRATAALARSSGSKNVVLLSDGEDHQTDPLGAAKEASGEGIQVFTIGIGTPNGEPIPLRDAGGAVAGYKKDKAGATVVSKLGEGDLAEIAKLTGGEYHRASPGAAEASEIARKIQGGGQGTAAAATVRRYRNHFIIPLALALLALLVETIVPETARRSLTLLLIGFCVSSAGAASSEGSLRQGNRLYDREEYGKALEYYERAAAKKPKDPRPSFNAGDALYRLEQYDKAAEAFNAAARPGAESRTRASAFYNLGNTLYQERKYKEAVDAYRKAVTIDPRDEQARYNLAVALRHLKNPPPENQQKKKDDKNQQQPPKDQKQDQQSGAQPQPKTRPQDQISKEDADRILRAVNEREKAPLKREEKAPGERQNPEKDW